MVLRTKELYKIFLLFGVIVFISSVSVLAENEQSINKPKPRKINKDVRDMTDADLEHLLDQWEEGDDPLEPDELPEHLRPQPKIDLSTVSSFLCLLLLMVTYVN